MTKAIDDPEGRLEPEVDEFLSLLTKIAMRLLTSDRAERENSGPKKDSEVANE
jgi:hypothetical protein